MAKKIEADVVIVGGATAGSYLAWRLAEKGKDVIVIEKKERGTLGKHIGIFHMDEIRFSQFDIPIPQGKELIGYFPDGLAHPPDPSAKNSPKRIWYGFYAMELPVFIERMQKYAEEAGASYRFATEASAPIIENGAVSGMRIKSKGGEDIDIGARVVVDASGVDAAARTRLPKDLGIETDPIDPKDFLYVILRYWDDIEGDFPRGLNFYPFHKAFINPSYGNGAIVGIGQPEKLETAERVQGEFLAEYFPRVKHRLVRKTWGKTPYRRSPFSLVADGFVAIGDAAFMTKPFSGEGVTSGFTAAQIASEVIVDALDRGDASKKALWALNTRYFRDQGAKFMALFAQLPAAAELKRDDVNFLFSKDIVFSSADFEQMNEKFEVKMGMGKLIATAVSLIAGRLSGKLSKEGFSALLSAMGKANKIRKHYEAYPESPEGFAQWEKKARALWGESDRR